VETRDLLRQHITDKAVVHGRVVLSSGREADYYVDMRRVTLDGSAAPLIGDVMLDLTGDLDIVAVGGLTLGADPVATAMLHAAYRRGQHLDAFVVRKSGKQHGLRRQIEGPDVAGRRVLAVEDTSTTHHRRSDSYKIRKLKITAGSVTLLLMCWDCCWWC
jgi:orotate phosphoribosyltransferase